jgi:predicted ester cyclase
MTTHTTSRLVSVSRTLIIVGVLLGSLLSPWGFRAASAPMFDTGTSGSGSGSGAGLTNEEIALRLFTEVLSGGNEAASAELVADIALIHTPKGEFAGYEGLNLFLASLRVSFSATTFEVNDLIVIGDIAIARWTMTGTRDGSFAAPVVIEGLSVLGFENGKIVETWMRYDHLDLARQIQSTAYTDMEYTRGAPPVAGVREAPVEAPVFEPRLGDPQ